MLVTKVFDPTLAFDANYKISAIDYADGRLYLGDENGVVRKYVVKTEQQHNIIPSTKDIPSIKMAAGRINTLKHLQFTNQILVNSGKQLSLIDGENLLKIQDITGPKDCELFALDEDPRVIEKVPARLLVLKGEKILFYEYEKNEVGGKFVLKSDNTKLLMKPNAIAWFGRNIFIGFDRKSYQVMDYDNRKYREIEGFKDIVLNKHVIKVVSEEETLCLGPSDVFIPVNSTTCDKLFKSSIQITSKFAGISVLHPYIVVLSDNKVYVFNKIDFRGRPRLLQEIPFDAMGSNVGKTISTSSNKIFFATTSKVFFLKPVPWEKQIQNCLVAGKVEDALMIFDQYNTEDEPDRQRKYDQLKIDAAWVYFKDLKFRDAEEMLKELPFDIKEFLGLFLSFVPDKTFFDVTGRMQPSMANVIEEAKKRPTSDNELKKDTNKAQRYAKEFLARILENRRKYLLDNYKDLHREAEFLVSEDFSPFSEEIRQGKVSKFSVMQLLEIVDFAIVRVYLDLKNEDKLSTFLSKKLFCKDYSKDLEVYFFQDPRPSDAIQAKFFEQFGRYKEALDVWSSVFKNYIEKAKTDRACEEIIRILTSHTQHLKDFKEKDLIFNYLAKVLEKNDSFAKTFFLQVDFKLISADQIADFLTKKLSHLSHLKEVFYEVLVNEKKVEEERFHTTLAKHYVKCIFDSRSSFQKQTDDRKRQEQKVKLNDYQRKFHNFLKDPSSRYMPETVLHDIKGNDLLEDEIFLYGKIKNHNEALSKLLELKKYDMAEQYCAEKQEKLLTKLFEYYIRKWHDISQNIKKDQDQPELRSAKAELTDVIHVFLKKYAAHPQLDPSEVLDNIPDDWDLDQDGQSQSGVYQFLFYALSYTLHNKRNSKVAKYVSQMDSLNSEFKLLKAQSAYVNITHNRKCAVCGKGIGKTVFVAYPNGVVAHHTCSQDKLNICPVTKQNFEKTFSG